MSHETIRVAARTAQNIPMAEFGRPEPRLRLVGVLTPVVGAVTTRFSFFEGEYIIGRESASAVYIPGEGISRQHARITRRGDAFVIEDLESTNGTFVDGVPVLTCTLRNGDAVQIGPNLFYFDRLLELIPQADSAASSNVNLSPAIPTAPPPGGGSP